MDAPLSIQGSPLSRSGANLAGLGISQCAPLGSGVLLFKMSTGKRRYALSLNGTSGYVDVKDAASLNFGAGAFSVELWCDLNATQVGGSFPAIIDKSSGDFTSGGAPRYGWHFGDVSAGTYAFRIGDGSSTTVDSVTFGQLNGAGLKHCIVTVNALADSTPMLRAYTNGVAGATVARTRGSTDIAQPVNIGRWRSYARYLGGIIDGVRIYNRALTPAEVTARYAKQDIDLTGLVASWNFDAWSNTIAIDDSGNCNHGTISGGVSRRYPLAVT